MCALSICVPLVDLHGLECKSELKLLISRVPRAVSIAKNNQSIDKLFMLTAITWLKAPVILVPCNLENFSWLIIFSRE